MEIIGKQELRFHSKKSPDFLEISADPSLIFVGFEYCDGLVFKQKMKNGKFQKTQNLVIEEGLIIFVCSIPKLKKVLVGA